MSSSFTGCNLSPLFGNGNEKMEKTSRQKFTLKSSSSDENSKKFQECFINFKWSPQHRDAFQYCKHFLYIDN